MIVLALARHTAIRFGEVGFALGALGALLMAAAAMMRSSAGADAGSARRATPAMVAGAVLVAVAFVAGIVFMHWGW